MLHTIYKSFSLLSNEEQDAIKEMVKEDNPQVCDDDKLYELAYEYQNEEFYDVIDDIHYHQFDSPVCITGILGLWNGPHEIQPVYMDDVEKAIKKCCYDMDYIEIFDENGELFINTYHHDGRNTFTIHKMVNGRKCKMHLWKTLYN